MKPRASSVRGAARRVTTVASELLLLLLAGCSQLPSGEDESIAVIENVSDAAPELPSTLHVLSWNVHGSAAARDSGYLRALADVIRAADADVVLLQEVHRGTRAGGGYDQFAELVGMTGMNGCFGRSMELPPAGGEYGNVILARAPLRAARTVRLPGWGEPRTLLRCDSQWDGTEVPLATTHLVAWDLVNRRERGSQVAAIVARLALDADPLTILGGDFNASQQAPEMLALREHSPVEAVAKTRLATYRGTGGSYDHLFAAPGWAARGSAVVRSGPSDHWPVSATLELRPALVRPAGVEAALVTEPVAR